MATATKKVGLPTPRATQKLTLGFGSLASCEIGIGVFADEAKTKVKGMRVCHEHGPGLQQRHLCSAGTKDEHYLDGWPETGYPHPDNPDQYVIVDKSVLDEISATKTGVVEITDFVDVDSIDPIYYDKTYLMWAQQDKPLSVKIYDLFARTMRDDRKAGIATLVLGKHNVQIVIRWSEAMNTLVLHTCYFNSQIRLHDVELIRSGVEARAQEFVADEFKLAREIISMNEGEFDASEVDDTYTPMLEDAIRAAAGGKAFTPAERTEPTAAPAADLLGALKASVEQAKSKAKPAAKKPAAKPRTKQPV